MREEVLAALAPHLPHPILQQALVAALSIENEERQVEVLAALVSHLPQLLRDDAIQQALTAAPAIENEYRRVDVLVALVARLTALGYPQQVLTAALAIEDEYGRVQALRTLAPCLPYPFGRGSDRLGVTLHSVGLSPASAGCPGIATRGFRLSAHSAGNGADA